MQSMQQYRILRGEFSKRRDRQRVKDILHCVALSLVCCFAAYAMWVR